MPERVQNKLSIILHAGFEDDTVIIEVDGTEVFRKEHITTSLLIGYADTFRTKVTSGNVSIRIIVPTRESEHTESLEVKSDVYLRISIIKGMIDCKKRYKPSGFI